MSDSSVYGSLLQEVDGNPIQVVEINSNQDVPHEQKNEDDNEEFECTWLIIPMIPFFLITFLSLIIGIINVYISFAEILNLTFYPICYEWTSLFSKRQPVHIVFTIFASLSDFGFFILLFRFAYIFVQKFFSMYIDNAKISLKLFYYLLLCRKMSDFYNLKNEEAQVIDSLCNSKYFLIYNIILLVINITLGVFSFLYKTVLIVVTFSMSLGFLILLVQIACMSTCYHCVFTTNGDDMQLLNQSENTQQPQNAKNSNIVKAFGESSIVSNMCSDPVTCCDELPCYKIWKIIFGLFIAMSQMYIIVVACIHYKDLDSYGKAGVIIGVIFKILFFPKAIDVNIFDSLINMRRTWKRLAGDGKIALIIVIIIYLGGISLCFTILYFSRNYDYPYIDYLEYNDLHTEIWDKFENSSYHKPTPSYCYVSADVNIQMSAPDFAVLTTLPRLYGINDAGKCYLKPKFRGVFNSTMKYIFGSNYHEQGITIYCWSKMHYPYLVLTSQKFLQESLHSLGEENYEILDGKEKYISQEYFNSTEMLCDYDDSEECISLQNCLKEQENNECVKEWETYTNKYWRKQTDSYVESMKGLEQYQVQIDDDFIIQPDYINLKDDSLMSGTHFIIGGGSEDQWGYAALLENFVRSNIPSFFGDFIPLYDTLEPYIRSIIHAFSQFALGFFYVDNLSTNEMLQMSNLITHFNLSHNNIYMVGHSISGTTIKEISYVSDICGTVFEASRAIGYAEYKVSSEYQQIHNHTKQIANIYSASCILTGNDDEFAVNGQLPNKFYNPNVYDTGCMTIASCSSTKQYYDFCNQVLNQHGEDSIKNFKEIIDAYLNE